MTNNLAQLIETNPLDQYQFVGRDGDRITMHASPLLATLSRLAATNTAKFFAIPVFNDQKSLVSWYSQRSGQLEAFWEMPDDRQKAVLDTLEKMVTDIGKATAKLSDNNAPESRTYKTLLPLLLNFPEPVEYHLYFVDGKPVATHWGMNKHVIANAQDTLTPFLVQWRERLTLREQQAAEAARNSAIENSFFGRLLRAGARSGSVEVTLLWNDQNDLDLHIDCPNGKTLSFSNKTECGGILDIDRNAHQNALTTEPVENIVWTKHPTCKGRYMVYVHFYHQHSGQPNTSEFKVRLKRGARVQYSDGSVVAGERAQVVTFDV